MKRTKNVLTVFVSPKIFNTDLQSSTLVAVISSETPEIQVAKCSEISRYFINHPEAGLELDHSIFQVICILQGSACLSYPKPEIFGAEQELEHL